MGKNKLKYGQWIPCEEQMPEEHSGSFDNLKGADSVIVTIEFPDKKRMSTAARTVNGEWRFVYCFLGEIKTIAWMPFPEPYGENKENAD